DQRRKERRRGTAQRRKLLAQVTQHEGGLVLDQALNGRVLADVARHVLERDAQPRRTGRRIAQGFADALLEALALVLGQALQELVAARKVAIEGTARDAGVFADVVHTELRQPVARDRQQRAV